jgi:hypothetical protein
MATVSGWITQRLGRFPRRGVWDLRVEEMRGTWVGRLTLTRRTGTNGRIPAETALQSKSDARDAKFERAV